MTCFLLTLCCKSVPLHCLPCFLSQLSCQQYKSGCLVDICRVRTNQGPLMGIVKLNPDAQDQCASVTDVLVNVLAL